MQQRRLAHRFIWLLLPGILGLGLVGTIPTASAQTAQRYDPWYLAFYQTQQTADEHILNLWEDCSFSGADWTGEYRKTGQWARSVGNSGQWIECTVPSGGDWYVGVIMIDDRDDTTETVTVSLNGSGTIGEILGDYPYVPDEGDYTFLYALPDPVTTVAGDRIRLTLGSWMGYYRMRNLLLWRNPIGPPDPVYHDLTAITLSSGETELAWWTEVDLEVGEQIVVISSGSSMPFMQPVTTQGSNHRLILPSLIAGDTYEARVVGAGAFAGTQGALMAFEAGQVPQGPTESIPRTIPLRVDEPGDQGRTSWPVVSGIPFPEGELAGLGDLVLYQGQTQIPLQAEDLSRWPDGSLQWVLISFLADTDPQNPKRYTLQVTNCSHVTPAPDHPVTVTTGANDVVLGNGLIRLELGGSGGLLERLWVDRDGDGVFSTQEQIMRGDPGDLRLIDSDGRVYGLAPPDRIEVLSDGPLMSEVMLTGAHNIEMIPGTFMRYRVRVRLFAGQPWVDVTYTLDVDGPEEMYHVQRLSLVLGVKGASSAAIGQRAAVTPQQGTTLLQDYDFKLIADGVREENTRDEGYVVVNASDAHGAYRVVAAVEDFWQTYPKGLAFSEDGLRLDLLPALDTNQYTQDPEDIERFHYLFYWAERENDYPLDPAKHWGFEPGKGGQYKLRLGMRVGTTFRVGVASSQQDSHAFARHLIRPLFAAADPDVYLRSGWFGPADPVVDGYFTHHENLFAKYKKGFDDGQSGASGRYGWYGFMNYGDRYPERQYNWLNQEYDPPWAFLMQFARTGRTSLLWRAERGARHTANIDIRHRSNGDLPHIPMAATGLPYKHCVGHVGGFFPDPRPVEYGGDGIPFYMDDVGTTNPYLEQWVHGCIDEFGHVVLNGLLTAGFLVGERDHLKIAHRAANKIAELSSKDFAFTHVRRPGWIISNLAMAYRAFSDPYLLNGARMIRHRTLYRRDLYDPATDTGGGILNPIGDCKNESQGTKTYGVGVLGEALLWMEDIDPHPEIPDMLADLAMFLVATNYKVGQDTFWYFFPNCPAHIDPDDNENDGYSTMPVLTAGFNADSDPSMCRVQNLALYFPTVCDDPARWIGPQGLRSNPRTFYDMRRWGFANTASVSGLVPAFDQGASCQHPCDPTTVPPDRPGCGDLPGEVCGDGFDNDLDGDFDESTHQGGACSCQDGERQPCGSDVGACQSGIQICAASVWEPCTSASGYIGPVPEVCDGIDNDCDGEIDDHLPGCNITPSETCDPPEVDAGAPADAGTESDAGTAADAEPPAPGDGRTSGCGCSTGADRAPLPLIPLILPLLPVLLFLRRSAA